MKVKPSTLDGAGDGLFTTELLPKYTVFGELREKESIKNHGLRPTSDGLQPTSDGHQPSKKNGLMALKV